MLSPLLPLPTASVKVPCMAGLLTYGSLLCPTFPRIRSGILDIARRLQSRGRLWILAPCVGQPSPHSQLILNAWRLNEEPCILLVHSNETRRKADSDITADFYVIFRKLNLSQVSQYLVDKFVGRPK
jgi:hypothetical protein